MAQNEEKKLRKGVQDKITRNLAESCSCKGISGNRRNGSLKQLPHSTQQPFIAPKPFVTSDAFHAPEPQLLGQYCPDLLSCVLRDRKKSDHFTVHENQKRIITSISYFQANLSTESLSINIIDTWEILMMFIFFKLWKMYCYNSKGGKKNQLPFLKGQWWYFLIKN